MKFRQIVTLLLSGILAFGSLNTIAAVKKATPKTITTAKRQRSANSVKPTKQAVKKAGKIAKKATKSTARTSKTSAKRANTKAIKTAAGKAGKNATVSLKNVKSVAKKSTKTTAKATKQAVKKRKKITTKATKAQKSALSLSNKTSTRQYLQTGGASFYADMFNGRRTANGEIFHNSKMTAAHRSLPFGSLVEVTNLRNGRSVIVRINDRGPYTHARVVDLSKAAARQIGMYHTGVARVKLAIVKK